MLYEKYFVYANKYEHRWNRKALINMLHELQKEKYKVTVLLLEKYGGFLDQIPDWVEVKYLSEYKNLKKYINEPPQKFLKNY